MDSQRDSLGPFVEQSALDSHHQQLPMIFLMNVNNSSNAEAQREAESIRMRTESETSEDGRKIFFPIKNERDNILRKVRSVLNKVSSLNYYTLQEQWLGVLPSGPEGHMQTTTEVLQLVVNKALDDTIYMHIYARLMGYVVTSKPKDTCFEIRLSINSQLHQELQKLATDKELALFDRAVPRADATRRRKVSLYRFIAELYCEKACTTKFFVERVKDLLIVNNPANGDENIECLCAVLTFAGAKLEGCKKPWLDEIIQKLSQKLTESPQALSKRIQFMVLDLIEMRRKGWSPHNKWWSPSVKISSGEETDSNTSSRGTAAIAPSTSGHTTRSKESKRKLTKKGNKHRSSSSRSNSRASKERVFEDRKGNPVMSVMEVRTLRRNLVGLLNKVSPENLHRIAGQLVSYLPKSSEAPGMDVAVNIIVDKVLCDGMYVRIHANLIARVVKNAKLPTFGSKIVAKVLDFVAANPTSVDGFRFLAELYQCDLLQVDGIVAALARILAGSPETLAPAVEPLAIFLFTVGSKLDSEVADRNWMTTVLQHLKMAAETVPLPQDQNRSLCLVMNVIDLRRSRWEHQQPPHWLPSTATMFSNRCETEAFIRLFGEDKQEFLRCFRLRCPTWRSTDRFFKDALEYAVCCGDWEKDLGFLQMTGACVNCLVVEGFITDGRLKNFLGTFLQRVTWMGRKNDKAWNNFRVIVEEFY